MSERAAIAEIIPAAAPFEIEPIEPTIGAEIRGLDLAQPMAGETFRALEAALVAHKVIYLRGQNLSTAQHVAFGRMFGELEVHPFRPEGAFPEIMVLDNHKDNLVLSTDVWHSDTTFRECPTKYSILRCLKIPRVGGDTLWADMCAAYDGLSDALKRHIDGLFAVHDFKNFRVLFGNGAAYLAYGILSGHFRRKLLPLAPRAALRDALDALCLRLKHDDLSIYNAAQRAAYLGAMVLIVLLVLSGLVLWKPVQLQGLGLLMGDYEGARYLHFFCMAGIVLFVVAHVLMVALVPRTFPPMITGKLRRSL